MSLDPSWFTGDDFVMVHPAAVAELDGDVLAVYVLARVRYRARAFGYDRDDRRWWRVSATVLADDLGLGVDRIKRTLRDLVRRGYLDAERHLEGGPYDRTLSYSLVFRGIAEGADSPLRSGEDAPSHGADSPLVHGADSPLLPIRSEEVEEQTAPLASLAEPVDNFEAFWQAYPRRIGEGAARRAWGKAIGHAHPSTIVRAARAYAASDLPEARYIPTPASWLRDGRWTDELPAAREASPTRGTAVDGTPPPEVADDPDLYLAWLRRQRAGAGA